jgi:hypothetical protein
VTRLTGTRYPWAVRKPRPCTLPRPIESTTSGIVAAMYADGENAMDGTTTRGSVQAIGSGAAGWEMATARPPVRSARPTGGTRELPRQSPTA